MLKLSNPVISLLSGFFLSLSAPGYDLWIIAWIGLIPLFMILASSKKIKEVLLCSFLYGLGYNILYLWWLASLHPLDWLGLSSLMSIVISIFSLSFVSVYNSVFFVCYSVLYLLVKKISGWPYNKGILKLVINTFLWLVVFNKISSLEVLSGFPWTLIEYSQYENLYLIQIAEYFGSVSISFLIVFFNLLLADILILVFSTEKIGGRYISRTPGETVHLVSGFSFFVILLLLSLTTGAFLFHKNKQSFSKKSKTVCVLQGNMPTKITRGGKMDIEFAEKTYDELIQNSSAELLILPEGALPTVFNDNLNINKWLKNKADGKQSNLISGTYCSENLQTYNCAVAYAQSDKKFSLYKKERLVPFGEFAPFSFLLPPSIKILARNLIGEGFKSGKNQALPLTTLGSVGVNICFEIIFPAIIRKHVLSGATVLVNLSDLSWFSNDIVRKQFLSFAVYRAVENRKWVIIAANSGISVFIEPNGTIKSRSLANSKGTLLDWINPNNKITLYAKYGW